jgi:hypothetical protein
LPGATAVTKNGSVHQLVDEAKDVSSKQQLSYFIRYTDNDVVNKKPIGAYHMRQVDATGLTSSIIAITDELKLIWYYLVVQRYDWASVISSAYSGIQTRI